MWRGKFLSAPELMCHTRSPYRTATLITSLTTFFALLLCPGLAASEEVESDLETSGTCHGDGAQSDDARERAAVLYRMAEIRYQDEEYDVVVELLSEAIVLCDIPGLHHNLGRALHQLGLWAEARDEYQIYLEREPEAPQRQQVEERIEALEQRLAEDESGREAGDDVLPHPDPDGTGTERTTRGRALPWPWLIAGLGAAAIVAGAVSTVMYQREVSLYQAPETNHLDAIESFMRAETYRAVALSTLISGGIVMAAGIVWGIIDLVRRRRHETSERIGLRVGASGLCFSTTGR